MGIDLSSIAAGTGGFVINGQCANDRSGFSVASVGDVNRDRLADVINGAADSNHRSAVAAETSSWRLEFAGPSKLMRRE